jgi:hypothetical protein
MVAEQKLRTQRILGGLLDKADVSKGGQFNGGRATRPPLSSFDISKYESSVFQKIAELPEDLFEEQIRLVLEETN